MREGHSSGVLKDNALPVSALASPTAFASDWMHRIKDVAAKLERMNRSTEADFLATTAKLTGFLGAARTISSEARAITDSMGGDGGCTNCQALQTVLDEATEMQTRANAATELAKIHSSLERVRRTLAAFESIGTSVRMMATLAQIETAHLGAAGMDFGHLAEDFRASGDSIRSRISAVLERASALEKRIEKALGDAVQFDDRCSKVLPPLVAAAGKAQNDLRARQEQSALTATHLAEQSAMAAAAISDIVASVQFHDITRQQVEHVIEALLQLQEEASSANASEGLPSVAAFVIELQLAQLRTATASFVDATRQMNERLGTIAGQLNGMATESGKLLGSSDNRERSFYVQMENSFRAIAEAVGNSKVLERGARKAIVNLDQTLGGLQESVGEVHEVERSLRWLAINAAISADHIGAAGEPLEAIAAALLRLLEEREGASEAADAAVATIAERVRAAIEASSNSDDAEDAGLLEQLRKRMDEMHALNEQTAQRSRGISSIAAGLSGEVDTLRHGISAERVFSATANDCCETLQKIMAQATVEGRPLDHESLLRLKERYTMNAERDVHDAIFNAAGPAVAAAIIGSSDPNAEFGENVELF